MVDREARRVTLCLVTTTKDEERDGRGERGAPVDEKAADTDKPRKERVLHTRVPAILEQELKRLAGSLRVPVSNVVRTILEDAVDTLDTVGRAAEGELRGVADRLAQRRDALLKPNVAPKKTTRAAERDVEEAVDEDGEPEPPLAGVVGYQPMLLARPEVCSLCGRDMAAGEQAYLGMREVAGGLRVVIGEECLPFSAAGQQEQSHE